MRILTILDMKNYTDDLQLFEVTHARALICKDGKYAMQQSKRGDYKLPGGRLEENETPIEALVREVKEETGLSVILDYIEEIGEITEIRRDVFDENIKYICHSLYYRCAVEDTIGETNLTENEIEKGLSLTWADLDEILEANVALRLEESRSRDTIFMRMIRDNKV